MLIGIDPITILIIGGGFGFLTLIFGLGVFGEIETYIILMFATI